MVLRKIIGGLFFSVALLMLAAPAAHAGLFQPQTLTLPNGLQVLVIENRRAPVVLHMLWYKAGSADETAADSGVAHFLEHMMFKGTRDNPDQDYSADIAALGGIDNAFTSYDYTAFFARTHPSQLERVMTMEATRIDGLQLDHDDIETERGVVQQERAERNEASAEDRFMLAANALFYHTHPYARPIIGTRETIAAYTKNSITDFYRAHYAANNAILIVVGDVQAAQVFALAEKIYGPLQPHRLATRERAGAVASTPMRLTRSAAEVQQAQLLLMWPAPSARQDAATSLALQVLAEVLNSPTSPLQQELLYQQNLAVGLQVDYDADRLDTTAFSISLAPRHTPAAGKDSATVTSAETNLAEAALRRILQRAQQNISDEAIKRAKQRLLDTATLARDSLHTPAYVFGMALTTGQSIAAVEGWPAAIAAVEPVAVRRAARLLTTTPLLTARLLPANSSVSAP